MRLMSACLFAFVVGACSSAEPVTEGAPAAQAPQASPPSQGQAGTTASPAGGTSAPSIAQAGTRASAPVAGQGGAAAPTQTSGGAGSPAASSGNAVAGSVGGAVAAAGSGNAGSAAAGSSALAAGASAPSTSCGNITTPKQPFGCKFAWGTNDPGGSLAAFAGLTFMSKWVGYELDMSGSLPRCDGCSWLREQVASTALVPVYYAYFIGYLGKANGLPDGNENPNGPNLTTDAAKLIRTQRAKLIGLYREYAKQTAQAWPDKPLVWLLEGDFIQYTAETQKEALSLTELADLAQELLPPDSLSWRIFKNPMALAIGGIAAVILELAEPKVRTGVWEHTSFRSAPLARLQRTGLAAMMTVYGPRQQSEAMIARIGRLHAEVKGSTPDGTAYRADDPELLDWVQATASFGFVEAYSAYVRPLTDGMRSQVYGESRDSSRLYGAVNAPTSLPEMQAMFEAMAPRLEASPIVFEFLEIMQRAPILPRIGRYGQRLLVKAAVELVPPWVRERLGLGDEWRLRPWQRAVLKLAGRTADRLLLRDSPAVQACKRLGLPPDHLYRPW